jgi:hypothetical protein
VSWEEGSWGRFQSDITKKSHDKHKIQNICRLARIFQAVSMPVPARSGGLARFQQNREWICQGGGQILVVILSAAKNPERPSQADKRMDSSLRSE